MEIRLGSLKRDAKEAQGTAIIIDVFRAFTTAAIAFDPVSYTHLRAHET